MALGGQRSEATAWLLLLHPTAEKGAHLPLHPMDLNSNPGLCLYITVMNTNMFASGLDSFTTMALLDFALFIVSVMAEGMSGMISQTSLFVLNLRHKTICRWTSNYSLFSLRKYLFHMVSIHHISSWVFYKLQFMVYLHCSCDFRWTIYDARIPEFPACSVTVNSGVIIYDKTIHSTCSNANNNILQRLSSEVMCWQDLNDNPRVWGSSSLMSLILTYSF